MLFTVSIPTWPSWVSRSIALPQLTCLRCKHGAHSCQACPGRGHPSLITESFGNVILGTFLCPKLGSVRGLEQCHLCAHLCPASQTPTARGVPRDSCAGSIHPSLPLPHLPLRFTEGPGRERQVGLLPLGGAVGHRLPEPLLIKAATSELTR